MSSAARPPPSSFRVMNAVNAAKSLRDSLIAEDGTIADDDRLLCDLIEGETDVFDLLDRIVEASMADGVLADMAAARAARLKARKDRLRQFALGILEALDIKKPVERAVYTASIQRRTKPIVTDASLLPEALLRTAPDMMAIGKALKEGPVPGVEQNNPQPFIVIRAR